MTTECTVVSETMDALILEFRTKFLKGMSAIEDAAKIYVKALDLDPAAGAAFAESVPEVPPTAWSGFEAVGRGSLDQRVLYAKTGLANRLCRIPLSQQRLALDDGVDFRTSTGATLHIKLVEATADQLDQVIGASRIRTIGEQRLHLESKNSKKFRLPVDAGMPYSYIKGGIRMTRLADFTKADLARILLELETR